MLAQAQIINNRYRIVRLLGQGGFGAVYRAWDLNLNIPVALKENTETSPEAARQFAREANILAGLRHPNLPKVTDYFVLPSQGQYLVMEYIEGEDLIEKLEKNGGPLPESEVLAIADQMLSALAYLHTQDPPIIHRDIKPQNIRITTTGQAILVDFGIAKLSDGSKKTTVGARAVTPGYSPHEQYGQGTTDQRTDIYALGATLYTLLTCQVPPESIERVIEDRLAPLSEYNQRLSPSIASAIMHALEVDPRKRWQTAEEMHRAFKTPMSSPPATPITVQAPPVASTVRVSASEPASFVGRVEPVPHKKKLNGIWIALSVVLLLGIVGFGSFVVIRRMSVRRAIIGTALAPTAPPPTRPPVSSPVQVSSGTTIPVGANSPDSIRIGVLTPLSGAVPSFGLSLQEGVQLAIDEWNAKGGVLGKRIEPLFVDTQCEGGPAVDATNKLIDDDQVKYIIGEVCSKASIPVSEVVNRKKVVQISPTSTNTAVTVDQNGQVKPFSFRACFIDPYQGMAMAKFARGKGYKTAFILYDPGNEYVRGLAEAFELTFTQNGGQIVGKGTYTANQNDFAPNLTDAKMSQADVLYLPDYYNVVNRIGAQAKSIGLRAVMMGGDGWDAADLDVDALDGGYYTNHYDPSDDRQAVKDWVHKYGEKYKLDGRPKVPDAIAALGYDSANLLIAAIEKAGVDDSTRVAEALAGLTWEGVTGSFMFDPQHNPVKNVAIIAIQNGRKFFSTSFHP